MEGGEVAGGTVGTGVGALVVGAPVGLVVLVAVGDFVDLGLDEPPPL